MKDKLIIFVIFFLIYILGTLSIVVLVKGSFSKKIISSLENFAENNEKAKNDDSSNLKNKKPELVEQPNIKLKTKTSTPSSNPKQDKDDKSKPMVCNEYPIFHDDGSYTTQCYSMSDYLRLKELGEELGIALRNHDTAKRLYESYSDLYSKNKLEEYSNTMQEAKLEMDKNLDFIIEVYEEMYDIERRGY